MFRKRTQKKTEINEQPPPDEVEVLFNNLLDNLDIVDNQKIPLLSLPISEKWRMIQKQKELDKSIPTPEYLLDQLKEKVTLNIVYEISQRLASSRISWIKHFCQINGHISLLMLIASVQVRIDFDSRQENDFQLISSALLCIKAILDSNTTYRIITSYKKSLKTIANSINPDRNIISAVFPILIVFLLEPKDDDEKLEVAKKVLKYFNDLDREGMNGWEVIISVLDQEETSYKLFNYLVAF